MTKANSPRLVFIRQLEVLERTKLSRSTLYEMIASNRFPPPLKLGEGRINVWAEHEITAWMEAQLAGR